MVTLKKILFSALMFLLVTSFNWLNDHEPKNAGVIGPYRNGKLPNINASWKTSQSFSELTFNLPVWLKKFPNQNAFLLTTKSGQVWHIEKNVEHEKKLVLDISDQGHNKNSY